jgi:hypothetical protein
VELGSQGQSLLRHFNSAPDPVSFRIIRRFDLQRNDQQLEAKSFLAKT